MALQSMAQSQYWTRTSKVNTQISSIKVLRTSTGNDFKAYCLSVFTQNELNFRPNLWS
jgi:hypothetical protein